MEDLLKQPPPSQERTEEMLDALEKLNDELVVKLERAGNADVKARYRDELLPRLENARRLVHRQSPLAKNVLEDATVLFRELHITAFANVVPPSF
jgi:hypothetical protein